MFDLQRTCNLETLLSFHLVSLPTNVAVTSAVLVPAAADLPAVVFRRLGHTYLGRSLRNKLSVKSRRRTDLLRTEPHLEGKESPREKTDKVFFRA
jgi:hypothetical protein